MRLTCHRRAVHQVLAVPPQQLEPALAAAGPRPQPQAAQALVQAGDQLIGAGAAAPVLAHHPHQAVQQRLDGLLSRACSTWQQWQVRAAGA